MNLKEIPFTLLETDKRKYPIEFSIPKFFNGINLYSKLFPTFLSNYKTEDKVDCYLVDDENELKFSIHMFDMVSRLLKDNGYYINYRNDNSIPFDLSSPIINLKNENSGSLYPEQYKAVKQIVSKRGSVCQARTGWGKNTLITYLCSHWTDNNNILIMAPILSILEEIKNRALQYDVKIKDDFSEKVTYIHPQGFLNSKLKYDENIKQYLKNVGLILIDECMNITPSMKEILTEYCLNYRCIYGFSATSDKYEGYKLSDILENRYERPFLKVRPETYSVLYYVGGTGFWLPDDHYFNMYINYMEGWNKEYVRYCSENFNLQYMRMENMVLLSKQIVEYAKNIINKIKNQNTKSTLMIPVKTYCQVDYLYDELKKDTSLSLIKWTSKIKGYFTNGEETKLKNLDEIKKKINNFECDVLICNKVGFMGVDFEQINDLLLCIGTKNGVNQIVGRETRGNTSSLNIWMLGNWEDEKYKYVGGSRHKDTPILDSSLWSRIKYIGQAHKCKFIYAHNGETLTELKHNHQLEDYT
jgi:superfamily II DNA or RNA helicase